MANMFNTSLSQVMIVKNEEENIWRALSWGKSIMAEQIVVDTGSTDRTVEIAERMGAKVFRFDWCDDFSAARNFAIDKARGSWIAFLDADEYFSDEDTRKIQSILMTMELAGKDVLYSAFVNLETDGKVISTTTKARIFRNDANIRYQGRVHESLTGQNGEPLRSFDASGELMILHTGYSEEAARKKDSSRRNVQLIARELEENPENSDMYGYLGDEFLNNKQFDNARKAYEKSISYMEEHAAESKDAAEKDPQEGQRQADTYVNLLYILSEDEKHTADTYELYNKGTERFPDEPDLPYVMGNQAFAHENFKEASDYLATALAKLGEEGGMAHGKRLKTNLQDAYEQLGYSLLQIGAYDDARTIATAVLNSDREAYKALLTLLYAYRKKEVSAEQTMVDISNFFNMNALRDRMMVYRGAMEAQFPGLPELVESYFSREELREYAQILKEGQGDEARPCRRVMQEKEL